MRKKPVPVTVHELEEILDRYLDAGPALNYAVKIVGHPGVGKSAIVQQVALRKNLFLIDTRLAFKENVDLGGYPVPDHDSRRMIYYRPRFIPPETVPPDRDGIVWFLDESNRAHPTVIQTLFQIITERSCGEHALPEKTSIVLAGNLGEADSTTITEFDDSALDGRLAVFHLRPSIDDWMRWAREADIHPAIVHYLRLFPDRLWDEQSVNPNPRGWHQVSLALTESYEIDTEAELIAHLESAESGPLTSLVQSLIGSLAGTEFVQQLVAPRTLATREILEGDDEKLSVSRAGGIPVEDLLWALSGAVEHLVGIARARRGDLAEGDLRELANVLRWVGSARADLRVSFFYRLLRDCGFFSRIPEALGHVADAAERGSLLEAFDAIVEDDDDDDEP